MLIFIDGFNSFIGSVKLEGIYEYCSFQTTHIFGAEENGLLQYRRPNTGSSYTIKRIEPDHNIQITNPNLEVPNLNMI